MATGDTKQIAFLEDVSKETIGLFNVDNTSDMDKPVSSLQQAEFDKKADETDFTTHTGNTTIHITQTEREDWNSKAEASHGQHVEYSTDSPLVNGTASVGTANTVSRSDHIHPTDTTRASVSALESHTNNTQNPHNVTKSQVGLENVDNTSDANKPVSTAQQAELDKKANATDLTTHTGNNDIHITSEERTSWNNKAEASHGVHVEYDDATPKANGTASAGTANTVSRSDHVHPTDTTRAAASDLTSHTDDTVRHITADERTAWNGKASASDLTAHTGDTKRHITDEERTAWNRKADASHGTHVEFASTTPTMDGDASVGTESTVARSDHRHPVDTSRASASDLTSHTNNTTIHVTSSERNTWNGKQEKGKYIPINLTVEGWGGSGPYTQNVTVTGVTADNVVIVSPNPDSWETAGKAMVYCSSQALNSLTFTSKYKPTTALSYNVLIQEV